MRRLTFFCLLLLPVVAVHAQEDYWQQFVHYEMDVTLLPIEHALLGDEVIRYQNNSPDTLRQFYLHLYPNAYRDNTSVRAQEARQFHQRLVRKSGEGGYIRIEAFRMSYNSPAAMAETVVNAYQIHDTILEVQLPTPLLPGGELTVELSFYLKVRKHAGRAGYRGFQYDFAQWYPKVVVYDESGWNAEPFHDVGEFYGEFGAFDVTINTPAEYIIGATGEVVAGDPGWDLVRVDSMMTDGAWQKRFEQIQDNVRQQAASGKLRSVTFHAENVHDFAWVASPDFLYESGEWDGIPIHVLYRSRVKPQWTRSVVQRSARALAWLSDKFGRYPYPQVTVVHGLLGGGMEYPMLVMNSSARESLILHEIGHIYFYGILANNEWKEAWLDEGLTTFQTQWYMETRYGRWGFDRRRQLEHANLLQRNRPVTTARESRRRGLLNYMRSGFDEPMSQPAHEYGEDFAYSENVYSKGAFFFDMLKYVVGDSTFEAICRTYFERWKFKHVNEARFKQVCEEVSGLQLSWFFDQWLHKTPKVDYSLESVDKQKSDNEWHTEVIILRREEGIMPVEVQLTTETGDTCIQRWDGFDKIGKVTFTTSDKPDDVVLDPNDQILDIAPLNNRGLEVGFTFDYPGMSYSPRDAYLVTWRPSGWYNEVDKLRLGGKLRGSYGVWRRAELGVWYGFDSQELDVRARYSNPIKALGARTRGSIMAQKMEGRLEIDGHLSFVKSRYLTRPPQHRFWVGLNYSRLLDGREDYVRREFDQKDDIILQTWAPGDVYKAYARYSVNPRGVNWFSNFTLGFDLVQEDWGSDFTYNSTFGELKFWFPNNHNGVFLRLFGQKVGDSNSAPIQDLIFLDGANPRQRFQRHYLRSNGSLPEELHYHLPGGGNLRGYHNNPIVGDQVLALNAEVRHFVKPPFARRTLRRVLGQFSAVAFADIASMEFLDSSKEFFADAGIGLRLHYFLPDDWYTIFTAGRHLMLRLDFPLWVNKPLPDESELRFRWVFGFEHAF